VWERSAKASSPAPWGALAGPPRLARAGTAAPATWAAFGGMMCAVTGQRVTRGWRGQPQRGQRAGERAAQGVASPSDLPLCLRPHGAACPCRPSPICLNSQRTQARRRVSSHLPFFICAFRHETFLSGYSLPGLGCLLPDKTNGKWGNWFGNFFLRCLDPLNY